MKAVLEFELPNDDVEFYWATNGARMNIVLWKMDQWLRSKTKHAPDDMSVDTYETFEECREKLRELIDKYDLDLDK